MRGILTVLPVSFPFEIRELDTFWFLDEMFFKIVHFSVFSTCELFGRVSFRKYND